MEIAQITTNQNHPIDLNNLDKLRKKDTWSRLSRGEFDIDINREYILPTVLLYAANSKMHELEARLLKANKTEDQLIRNKETQENSEIVENYCISIEYINQFKMKTHAS